MSVDDPQIRYELKGLRFEGREPLPFPSGLLAGHYTVVFMGIGNVGVAAVWL